jgi:hypothetical protein
VSNHQVVALGGCHVAGGGGAAASRGGRVSRPFRPHCRCARRVLAGHSIDSIVELDGAFASLYLDHRPTKRSRRLHRPGPGCIESSICCATVTADPPAADWWCCKGSAVRAHEVTFLDLVQGERHFQVPLYQRTYSWSDIQLAQLWRDILAQCEVLAAGTTVTSWGPLSSLPVPHCRPLVFSAGWWSMGSSA